MAEINYYQQIVNSYIKQNTSSEIVLCLPDDLSDEMLGRYICAMANTAVIMKSPYIYAFWGVKETTKELYNSTFIIPDAQNIEIHLSTNIRFSIRELILEQQRIIVLEVQRAYGNTIQYDGTELILKDSSPTDIKTYPKMAQDLWTIIYSQNKDDFCSEIALKNVSVNEVMKYLNWEKFFEMIEKPISTIPNALKIMSTLCEFRFITEENTGKYNITNLGALLLARKLSSFKTVEYKAIRVLIYSGNNNTTPAHEQIGGKGYIIGFQGLIKYIQDHIPKTEYIDGAIRKKCDLFPIISIRELVANAIIHQDLNEKGCPIISIFDDHITVSNPGVPMIETNRFIDNPPHSRNESLAAAMHRVGICEERGSGYDKIISHIEANNLLAPEIILHERNMSVILWKGKKFEDLTKDELIRICYDHTCLNYIQGKITNNTSLRTRFKMSIDERYKITRAFKPAVAAGLIKEKEGTGPKNREYIPYWA